MATIIFPLLLAVFGALVYFAATKNGKVAELGRIGFFCGLFVLTLELAEKMVRLLR